MLVDQPAFSKTTLRLFGTASPVALAPGIALRSPCCAQAQCDLSMAARSTHASHPFGRSSPLRGVVREQFRVILCPG
jgi:hypothetical protein